MLTIGIAEVCDDYQCVCRDNVEGPNCDRCKAGFFGLSSNNEQGCQPCWCSGVTDQCSEARLSWSTLRMTPSDPNNGVKLTDK